MKIPEHEMSGEEINSKLVMFKKEIHSVFKDLNVWNINDCTHEISELYRLYSPVMLQ